MSFKCRRCGDKAIIMQDLDKAIYKHDRRGMKICVDAPVKCFNCNSDDEIYYHPDNKVIQNEQLPASSTAH